MDTSSIPLPPAPAPSPAPNFRNTRWALIAVAAAVVVVVLAVTVWLIVGAGGDRAGSGRAGAVTTAASLGNANPLKRSGLAIGVGDVAGPAQVTQPSPEQISARCHGDGDGLSIDLTAPNGWTVHLVHGSQTLTAANAVLGYPAGELTTAAGTIDMSNRLNKGGGFPLGITWDKPGGGDVEVQFSQTAPANWKLGSTTEFMLFAHVRCGA
ncbi:hypothetical protein [Nocardia tengchongensis]|uniref:hypothetical protein n=1 Tax=Nocardia tengchongensis TaxID=2055889 RepID=UPI003651F76A